jgi:hypothetical protein
MLSFTLTAIVAIVMPCDTTIICSHRTVSTDEVLCNLRGCSLQQQPLSMCRYMLPILVLNSMLNLLCCCLLYMICVGQFIGKKKPLSLLCKDISTISKHTDGIDKDLFKAFKKALPGTACLHACIQCSVYSVHMISTAVPQHLVVYVAFAVSV